jgi:hypothetical protein
MADRKISELNAATAGNLHEATLFHGVDLLEAAAADQNVKVTLEQLRTGLKVSGYTLTNLVQYTANGSFALTDYPHAKLVRLLYIGGGGGGGGAAITAAGQASVGGGGGGGGVASVVLAGGLLAEVPDPMSIVVGAGGTATAGMQGGQGGTTYSTYQNGFPPLRAYGGSGGYTVAATAGPAIAWSGLGGTYEQGDETDPYGLGSMSCRGYHAHHGLILSATEAMSGHGGHSPTPWGGGSGGAGFPGSSAGNTPTSGYGAGGSGAKNGPSQGTASAGGAGRQGLAVVFVYA